MTLIGDKKSKETAERVARQKELAKVTIKKEDVELIVREKNEFLFFKLLLFLPLKSDLTRYLIAIFRSKSLKYQGLKRNLNYANITVASSKHL